MSTGHIERVVTFGPERALIGILTAPAAGAPAVEGTVVLLLNAGVIHRVGPNRINVGFARELAAIGLTSLRFDQSGLGDSAPREGVTDLFESVARDMRDAMAYLAEHHGAQKFVLVGICSGARAALRACYEEPNIAGAIVIDPPVYKTARAVVGHFAPRLLRPESWKTALSGRNQRITRTIAKLRGRTDTPEALACAVPTPAPSTMPDRLPDEPTREEMTDALAHMLGKRTRMLWIYTGGSADAQYNYRDQLRDAFPDACKSGLLDWDLMSDVDHDFRTEAQRRQIRRAVRDWLVRRDFAAPSRS